MRTQPHSELVLLETLCQEQLVYPSTGRCLDYSSLSRYMRELGIITRLERVPGELHARRHVTRAQAAEMVALFRRRHRRQFEAKV